MFHINKIDYKARRYVFIDKHKNRFINNFEK